jgi:hypothetical protein
MRRNNVMSTGSDLWRTLQLNGGLIRAACKYIGDIPAIKRLSHAAPWNRWRRGTYLAAALPH